MPDNIPYSNFLFFCCLNQASVALILICQIKLILFSVIRNFAPPKFRKVKPPTKNTINKECKCGKNREAFINFVVETKK